MSASAPAGIANRQSVSFALRSVAIHQQNQLLNMRIERLVCRMLHHSFPNVLNGSQSLPATPRDMNATWGQPRPPRIVSAVCRAPAARCRRYRMPSRRFPPPWSVEELDACFVVRDHNGQQLAYVYFEDGRRSAPSPVLCALRSSRQASA